MTFSTKGTSEIVVGGDQPELVRINIERGIMSSSKAHDGGVITKMKKGSMMIGLGLASGGLEIVDPNTLSVVRKLNAHAGPISDMDCRENIVVTCGYSPRKNGYMLDPLVNIFDIRAMKPLSPIPFPAGAGYVKLHPKLSTYCVIASQSGQIQFLDYVNPANVYLYHASINSALTGFEISSSGDYMALTDGDGFVQLWSNAKSNSTFTEFSTSMELPTIQEPMISINLAHDDDEHQNAILSTVGMPYYKEELLSSWSGPNFIFDMGMPSPEIDSEILASMKVKDFVGYSANKANRRRNLAQKYESLEHQRRSSLTIPKFISERKGKKQQEDEQTLLFDEDEGNSGKIPKAYRRLEIKYSKFGVNDFDFDFYNKTSYSGLETQIANSYCNSLLQLYRFSPLFYNFALDFVSQHNVVDDKSLLNELGLLFDMLHKGEGKNCRASNFVATLEGIQQASALGLIYDEISPSKNSMSQAQLIKAFCRFLMERIVKDETETGSSHRLDELFGLPTTIVVKSLTCGAETIRQSVVYNIDLPRSANNNTKTNNINNTNNINSTSGNKKQATNFVDCLQSSLEKWTQTRGWCEKCRKYQMLGTLKSVRSLPELLNVHISQESPATDRKIWSNDNWPAKEFSAGMVRGKLTIRDIKRGSSEDDKYELQGMVVEISDHHLVCLTKADDGHWYLFNDFLVKAINESEVLDFSSDWKTPAILLYQKAARNASQSVKFDYESWKSKLDTEILYKDYFAAGTRQEIRKEYQLLTNEEVPYPGMLVAIDAEFVMLQQEETEIKSDGTKSLLRPTLLSLARVSVLRGEGPNEGVPFIDDYIATTSEIVDYLTEFSGIENGDLDPNRSTRSLVTLQTSYKRLWLLLNLGCIFIGHGLHNDFRTINIQVPSSQVIDTLDIFYLPHRQRKISLKFLAWYLLYEDVQQGNHDSIEDARTALRLYRKYQELQRHGSFESTLEELYAEGRKYNFKPPKS